MSHYDSRPGDSGIAKHIIEAVANFAAHNLASTVDARATASVVLSLPHRVLQGGKLSPQWEDSKTWLYKFEENLSSCELWGYYSTPRWPFLNGLNYFNIFNRELRVQLLAAFDVDIPYDVEVNGSLKQLVRALLDPPAAPEKLL